WQRCLTPVSKPVECDISLAIVWTEEEAKALPKHLDPWIVEEISADFFEMVEEELLLSLPPVAYHEEQCVDPELFQSGEPVVVKHEKKNPFQVLEQLKSSPKKKRRLGSSVYVFRRSSWPYSKTKNPVPSVTCVVHTML